MSDPLIALSSGENLAYDELMSTEPIPMPERLAARRAQMFPALTPAQLARVAAVAEEQRFQHGDVLFEPGHTETPMFVVLEGEVELADITPHGPVRAITLHAGEFTGEANLLRRGPALVRARACGATRVLRVAPVQLGALLQDDSELGNVLLRAFMLRRSALIEASAGSALVTIRHLFSMAGADPHTQWVSGLLARDAKGFILTGAELSEEDLAVAHWSKARRPLLFETDRTRHLRGGRRARLEDQADRVLGGRGLGLCPACPTSAR